MNGKKLNANLHRFLRHLDSIKDTLPMTILLIKPYQVKAEEKLEEFLKTSAENIEIEDGKKAIAVKYEESKVFERLAKNSEISTLASKIIPESLFVSLISQYDAFFNRLLRALFEIRPELVNNSEKELTFSELVKFSSLNDAKEFIIEKEVEGVLRKSHSEHFSYLETKLSMPLRKGLAIWSKFIEITERRNLLVHCDGVVSNQYIKVCKEHNCDINDIKVNKKLIVTPEYFKDAYECLYEIATKLTHTLWRKILKDDLNRADSKLNAICFDLIQTRHFKLADILLDFACSQKKHYNDAVTKVFIVNKALSKYLQEEKEEAKKIISSKDWSASSDDFKLAHLVLTEEFDSCYDLMKKIGDNGEVDKENYKTWPLFLTLRKEKKYKDTYKEIFNEEYTVLEIPQRPVQELIGELMDKTPEIKNKTITKELSDKQKKERELEDKEE